MSPALAAAAWMAANSAKDMAGSGGFGVLMEFIIRLNLN